jgi:hypothetical protein
MLLYASIVGLGVLGAISDATLNEWAQSHRGAWLVLSYALWIAVATLFGFLLRSEHLSFGVLVVLFLLANSAIAVVLDRVVFGGSIRPGQWAGLAFALLAVVCIEYGRAGSSS